MSTEHTLRPDIPPGGNAGFALRFAFQHHWPGVPQAGALGEMVERSTNRGVNCYDNERIMNAESSRGERSHVFLGSRPWSRAILLALQLYPMLALGFIWMLIHYGPAGSLRPMGAPILDPALLLGYVLCLCALFVVGLKQLRSGARRTGLLNFGLSALTGLLGWGAWYLLSIERRRWF